MPAGARADVFQIFRLEAKPDGTFSGDFTETNANTCSSRRDVTFIRTGDLDLNSVPDPASQPPRAVSPAEALRGRYKYTLKFSTGGSVGPVEVTARTDCVRAGDSCSSFFYSTNPKGGIPLVFADGQWTWTMEIDASCGQGKTSHVSRNAAFPLPAPPQDPIGLLTGHGHDTVTGTGECAADADVDVTFERSEEEPSVWVVHAKQVGQRRGAAARPALVFSDRTVSCQSGTQTPAFQNPQPFASGFQMT